MGGEGEGHPCKSISQFYITVFFGTPSTQNLCHHNTLAAIALEAGNQRDTGDAREGADSEGATPPRGDTQTRGIAANATMKLSIEYMYIYGLYREWAAETAAALSSAATQTESLCVALNLNLCHFATFWKIAFTAVAALQ